MNTRTLITGLALSASLLIVPSAMAANAPANTGTGGGRDSGLVNCPPNTGTGGRDGAARFDPTSNEGGPLIKISPARFDPTSNEGGPLNRIAPARFDPTSNEGGPLNRIAPARYYPIALWWVRFALR